MAYEKYTLFLEMLLCFVLLGCNATSFCLTRVLILYSLGSWSNICRDFTVDHIRLVNNTKVVHNLGIRSRDAVFKLGKEKFGSIG